MMGLSSNQDDRPLIGLDDEDAGVNHNFRQIPDISGSTSRSQPLRFSPVGVLGTGESHQSHGLGTSRIDHHESTGSEIYNEATVADVERIMRKYTGNMLVALQDVTSRLSLFEERTSYLENSMKELKMSIANNAAGTDGKLRQLENILKEVQNEVHDIHGKQEIAKLQTCKVDNEVASGSRQHTQEQSIQQQQAPHSAYSVPSVPNSSALPPQQKPSFTKERPILTQGQSQETIYTQYQFQTPPPLAAAPPQSPFHQQQQYGSPPLPSSQQYGTPPQVPQYCPPVASSPPQPPVHRYHEDTPPYVSESQAYPQNIRQPSAPSQPPFMPPPSQFYSPSSDTFDPSAYRAGFPDRYGQGGYGTSSGPRLASHFSSDTPSGGGMYQQSPIAEVIPRSKPSIPDTESTGTPSVEEIVSRVASMGFSKGLVRATIKKMSQEGQSVNLNDVLDKLTNEGEIIQPQSIWREK